MFDKKLIIPDKILTEYYPYDVQGFLDKSKSPLAVFKVDGLKVSEIITTECKKAQIDPRFILTKLQVEQSLLFQPPTKEKLDWALGYGCPDSGERIEKYRGFAKQIEAAAKGIKGYLDPGGSLYVGNKVGKEWKVSDGIVICNNTATAALYRYTPWIGDKDYGPNKTPFGNYLFYRVWTTLFGAINFDETSQPAHQENWRVIAPPDNWRNPVTVTDEELQKFEKVAESLGLKTNRDSTAKKLYLKLPGQSTPATAATGESVKYPSGESFSVVDGSPWQTLHSKYWSPHSDVAAPLIRNTQENRKLKLSEHFTLGEFVCKDPSYDLVRVSPQLMEKLEEIRKAVGEHPVNILSAYRPYPYNAAISGAADNSYHIDGVAADIYINGMSTSEISSLADKIIGDGGGVGTYYGDGFVHVDVRGYWVRW